MVIKSRKPEEIAITLSKALERGDSASFTASLMEVVRAGGMTSMAKRAGVSRYTLYRYEAGNDRPLLETTLRMAAACGFKLMVVPDDEINASDPPAI
jgi:probable addiction module antidote protein